MSERVARSRELVDRGHKVAAVARVLQVSRQAIYRTQSPRHGAVPAAASRSGRGGDRRGRRANQTDGYRMVTAFVRRRLGRPVNRKRVLRVMRERKLIQRRRHQPRRRRPGVLQGRTTRQLWHLDMTSVWVAEHGWVYLNAIIDCCTREIVGWDLTVRCRAHEAIAVIEQAVADHGVRPGQLTLGTETAPRSPPERPDSCSPPSGSPTAAAATATPRARRSSSPGSATSRNAASGATSSKPSTRPGS